MTTRRHTTAALRRIDPALSVRAGALFIEECGAAELARRYGTPLNVVSEDQLRRNVERYRAAFAGAWPDGEVRLLPSLKANFALAVRRVLSDAGTGCDVFGASELHAALLAGVAPELISVNGSGKDASLIRRAVREGCRLTLDSVRELPLVLHVARELGRTARIRLRVRPDYSALQQPSDFFPSESVAEAAHRYKPGIPLEELLTVGPEVLAAPELDLCGLHVHLGRQSTDLDVWRGMAEAFAVVVLRLRAAWPGWEPRELDIGGGFAAPRDPTSRSSTSAAPSIEAYASATAGTLRRALSAGGMQLAGVVLELEPGRGLHADAGIHLARVRGTKRESAPAQRRWIELDSSEAFLPDVLIEGAHFSVVAAEQMDAAPDGVADVVGISCGFDQLVRDAALPALSPGDVVAFLDTGAYQDAASSNFNAMPRPATVLVSGIEAEVVKRAETLEDVFARDHIPARLAGDPARRRVQGVDHAGLTVADLERSLAFYVGGLGLELRGRGVDAAPELGALIGVAGARLAWVELELGDGRMLELLQYLEPVGVATASAPIDPGNAHLALAVEDLSAAVTALIVEGFQTVNAPVALVEGDWHGVRTVYVRDPDDHIIELVERARS